MADADKRGDLIAEAKELLAKRVGQDIPREDWEPTIQQAQALLLMSLAHTMTDISETLLQFNVTFSRPR